MSPGCSHGSAHMLSRSFGRKRKNLFLPFQLGLSLEPHSTSGSDVFLLDGGITGKCGHVRSHFHWPALQMERPRKVNLLLVPQLVRSELVEELFCLTAPRASNQVSRSDLLLLC